MRIITGKARGHRLKFPRGTTTRPATDLVRGAIFSILENLAADWRAVLDLYSGSGALGIEALSRGAGNVDFVERDPRCCAIIKENLEKTKLAAQGRVYCCPVARAVDFLDKEYGIILVDPPYADLSIDNLLEKVAGSSLVGPQTVVVVTHSSRRTLAERYAQLALSREYRHGDSCIAIYRKGLSS